jgi:hypothetical protein
MRPRTKGVMVSVQEKPSGALYEEAIANLKARKERSDARKAKRDAQPVPNWIAYRDIIFVVGKNIDEKGNWLGGKLPKCKKCGYILPPQEHHECSGFVPKFVEHDAEWHERQDAKREEIRESREDQRRKVVCSVCGEEMPEPEGAEQHYYSCGEESRAVWEGGYDITGEHDGDLDGYEDEPEEDYCEGDDDGYDCD